jgi:hypothetical protein
MAVERITTVIITCDRCRVEWNCYEGSLGLGPFAGGIRLAGQRYQPRPGGGEGLQDVAVVLCTTCTQELEKLLKYDAPEAEEVFECQGCKRVVPWSQGAADDHPELCDSCWSKRDGGAA